MSYYKIPQDVEAEDKLIGPFTFKQFLFLIGFFISGFLMITIGAQSIIVGAFFLPFVLFFGLLGFYHPKDQPVENKILAYLNFFFRPHTRMWSRDGIIQHVTIKVPKKVEKYFADERSPDEVRSQLKNLAQVVDTRGWSTKQSQIQLPGGQTFDDSDRIYNPVANAPLMDSDVKEDEDMFNEYANPVAQSFTQLSEEASTKTRAEVMARMRQVAEQPEDAPAVVSHSPTATPSTSQPATPTITTPTEPVSQPAVATSAAKPDTPLPQAPVEENSTPTNIRYNPYGQIHQKVINPYGQTEAPKAESKPSEHYEVPEELKQMAQNDMSISAIQRHAKEYEDKSEGEISIDH